MFVRSFCLFFQFKPHPSSPLPWATKFQVFFVFFIFFYVCCSRHSFPGRRNKIQSIDEFFGRRKILSVILLIVIRLGARRIGTGPVSSVFQRCVERRIIPGAKVLTVLCVCVYFILPRPILVGAASTYFEEPVLCC